MDTKLEDLRDMRAEILERVKVLHQSINLAVVLETVLIISSYWLKQTLPSADFDVFILLIPIIFGGLTFNYQANQMTMEAVARYIRSINPNWEENYGSHKQKVQLTSFLKVLPLLLPQLLPLFVFASRSTQPFLWWVDIVILLLVLFNFRYKVLRY